MEAWLEIAGRQLIVGYFLVAGVCNLTPARIDDHIARMGYAPVSTHTAFMEKRFLEPH